MMKRVEGRRPAARWNRYDAVRRIVEERDLAGRRVVRRGTWPVSIGRSLLLLLAKMRVMPVSVLLVIASVAVGVLARVPAMLLGAVPVLLPVMPVGVMFVITSVAVGVLARMPVMLVSVVLVLLPIEGLLSEWFLCLAPELPECRSKFPRWDRRSRERCLCLAPELPECGSKFSR